MTHNFTQCLHWHWCWQDNWWKMLIIRDFIIIISISLTKFQQDNSKKKTRGPIYYPLTLVTIISYYPLCILPFCCGCKREDSHVVILSGNIIAPICFYLSSFPPLYFIIQEFTRHVYCCSVACSPVSQLHVIAFKWSSQMTNKKTINSSSNKTKLMNSHNSSENREYRLAQKIISVTAVSNWGTFILIGTKYVI